MSLETDVPLHLKKYIVEQQPSSYTAIDQSVWRFLLRQLRAFLSEHGHPIYLKGLEETGISVEQIPSIAEMSEKLKKYGWRAVPVSGFIPPAAFMELQALGYLPIASEMRTLEHLEYTPAPDIVHEAAGHAPILIDPEYSAYLKKYAQLARRSILNLEDLEIYECIRNLSDIKEDRTATEAQIELAQAELDAANERATTCEPSEAALLARMNWWTAEYGLIGSLEAPLIYGAGLLSSFGESRDSLQDRVRKVPFSLKCLDFSYDITEPQPQLFVTPDFKTLSEALDEFASSLAYNTGGILGLEKLMKSRAVNTVQLNSGLQISGVLARWIRGDDHQTDPQKKSIYLQFKGPTQLAYDEQELPDQGCSRHPDGFGTPIGYLKYSEKCLSEFTSDQLGELGVTIGQNAKLEYQSGLTVTGRVKKLLIKNSRLLIVTFDKCTVSLADEVFFDPAWGDFDMAVGSSIPVIFGGPADREAFGDAHDFVAKRVQVPPLMGERKSLAEIYALIREIRETRLHLGPQFEKLESLVHRLNSGFEKDWLARLEILELASTSRSTPPWEPELRARLESMAQTDRKMGQAIAAGLAIANIL